MLLLEGILVGAAQRHDAAHIHLVEGGQHGGGVLGLLQALGDALAQARHAHPLLSLVGRPGRCRSRSRCSRRRCGGRGCGLAGLAGDFRHGLGVGLGEPAILACAGCAADIEIGFADDLAYRGCERIRRLATG